MIGLLFGLYLVGAAVCVPLFFDRDDPWGIAFALLWPLLVLAALGVGFVGLCRLAYASIFPGPPIDFEDPHG